jgi:ligand-binding SRPBCC domain-containing protein
MPTLVFESVLPFTPEQLWEFHNDVKALPVLTPPGTHVEIVGDDTSVRNGAIHKLKVTKFGVVKLRWDATISEVIPGQQFVDSGAAFPFKHWHHLHEFLPHPSGAILKDTLDYQVGLGPIRKLIDALIIRKDLERMFAFRHKKTEEFLKSSFE